MQAASCEDALYHFNTDCFKLNLFTTHNQLGEEHEKFMVYCDLFSCLICKRSIPYTGRTFRQITTLFG